jgi:hypothetical protein
VVLVALQAAILSGEQTAPLALAVFAEAVVAVVPLFAQQDEVVVALAVVAVVLDAQAEAVVEVFSALASSPQAELEPTITKLHRASIAKEVPKNFFIAVTPSRMS